MPELREPQGPLAPWHKAIYQVFNELEPDEWISLMEVNRRRQRIQGVIPGMKEYWGGQAGSVNAFVIFNMVKRGHVEMKVVAGRKQLRKGVYPSSLETIYQPKNEISDRWYPRD